MPAPSSRLTAWRHIAAPPLPLDAPASPHRIAPEPERPMQRILNVLTHPRTLDRRDRRASGHPLHRRRHAPAAAPVGGDRVRGDPRAVARRRAVAPLAREAREPAARPGAGGAGGNRQDRRARRRRARPRREDGRPRRAAHAPVGRREDDQDVEDRPGIGRLRAVRTAVVHRHRQPGRGQEQRRAQFRPAVPVRGQEQRRDPRHRRHA